jgi:hypothetical protein
MIAALAVSLALASAAVYFAGDGELGGGSPFALVNLVGAVGFPAFGALILLRRPGHPIGRTFLLCGLFSGIQVASGGADTATHSGGPLAVFAAWVHAWTWVPAQGFLTMALLVFPDGRSVSPRWAWLTKGLLAVIVAGCLAQGLAPFDVTLEQAAWNNPVAVEPRALSVVLTAGLSLLLLVFLAGALISLLVRFRRSRGEVRAQMKWMSLGGCVLLLGLLFGAGVELTSMSSPEAASAAASYAIALSIVPVQVAVAVAILKYHLYEIDHISRSLVYTVVTALLAGLYSGLVLLVSLVSPLATDSPAVVAISTLAIAAAFGPLRRRVQGLIDLRFNRARYDAVRTLDELVLRLRNEVDVGSLSRDLVTMVDRTFEPQTVSLRLRDKEPDGGYVAAAGRRAR